MSADAPKTTTGVLTMWDPRGDNSGVDAVVDYKNLSSTGVAIKDFEITLEDMKTMPNPPQFATHGYEWRAVPTKTTTEQFLNVTTDPEAKAAIEGPYFKECGELLEKMTGGDLVIPYNFHLRKQDVGSKNLVAAKVANSSLKVAHCDLDWGNAAGRMMDTIGEERAEMLMKKYKRWASVNVWRPIGETVKKWPLCLVNHQKIPDWDYETHMKRVHSKGHSVLPGRGSKNHDTVLIQNDDYVYHYAADLQTDEVLIFCSWDTNPKYLAPHSAFWDNSSSMDAASRRSLETRSWVFWDPVEE